jgi:hypothetical protein
MHTEWIILCTLFFTCGCEEHLFPQRESINDALDLSVITDPITDLMVESFVDLNVSQPDQGLVTDMALEPSLDFMVDITPSLSPWELTECDRSTTPLLQEESDINSQTIKDIKYVGSPLGKDQLLAYATSDHVEEYQWVTLLGGYLEVRDQTGRLQWQSNVGGLISLYGLYDFNGDGSLEILIRSSLYAHIFSLSNGQELWRSQPSDLGGDERISSIASLKVSQVNDELYPYLYLADAGCSTAGTGYGVVYQFIHGFESPVKQPIRGPRTAGRCSKWHTLFRQESLSTQDQLHVMITDQNGLHTFSSQNGERLICGHLDRELVSGRLAYKPLSNLDSASWVSVLGHQVSMLQVRDWQAIDLHCDPHEQVLSSTWTTTLDQATPIGLFNMDLTRDNFDEIWVNHHHESTNSTPSSEWMTSILDGLTGEVIATLSNMAILGPLSWQTDPSGLIFIDLLVAINPPSKWLPGAIASDIQAIRVNLTELNDRLRHENLPFEVSYQPLWSDPISQVKPIWTPESVSHTPEFQKLELLDGSQGQSILMKRTSNFNESDSEHLNELLSVHMDGSSSIISSEYDWGMSQTICSKNSGCSLSDRILVTENTGSVSTYTSDFDPNISTDIDTGFKLVTGRLSHSLYLGATQDDSKLVTLSEAGKLSVFPLRPDISSNNESSAALWDRPVSYFTQPGTNTPNPPFISSLTANPLVIVYDKRTSRNSDWIAYDLESGEEVWRHHLSSSRWRTEKQSLIKKRLIAGADKEVLYRLERALTPESLSDLPSCEGTEHIYTNESLQQILQQCPEATPTARVIHALDVSTGECLWRTIVDEHNPCVMPALQYLSLVDVDQDGLDELYLLESDSLRQFNLMNGELERTAIIPNRSDGRFVSGGWLKAYQDGLLRFGTYSPPDLFYPLEPNPLLIDSTPLAPIWFGESISGLRNQSWLLRWSALTSSGIWISLGLNKPLARYNQNGELDKLIHLSIDDQNQVSIQANALNFEAPIPEAPNIMSLAETSDDGLMVATDEGGLFILDEDGELKWGKSFRSIPSLPHFIDWDQDGAQEWIISTSNGELLFYDQQSYIGITDIWEASCSESAQCSSAEDIDQLIVGRPLCIGWVPLEGISGAAIQLQTMSGTALTEWIDINTSGRLRLDDLLLIAGNEYKVSIRTWVTDENDHRIYTEASNSDGFIAIDDQPPIVSLSIDRVRTNITDLALMPLMIMASARDEVRLAGWSLVIYTEQGSLIKRINSSSTQQEMINLQAHWQGNDQYDRIVDIGRYRMLFAVTDSAGNQSNSEVWVSLE